MKLRFSQGLQQWVIGDTALHCGQQVQICCHDINGEMFYVNGRFEIAGANNPVFHTTFGSLSPDLNETFFRL